MKNKLKYIIPGIAFLLLCLTFVDWSKKEKGSTFSGLESISNTEWIFSCGNPNLYEKLVIYENGKCWYSYRNLDGTFGHAGGEYIFKKEEQIFVVKYIQGKARKDQVKYEIKKEVTSNRYFVTETRSKSDVRFFFLQNRLLIQPAIKPELENSSWIYSCGTPEIYEKIIFNEDQTCLHIENYPSVGRRESKGTYKINYDKILTATFSSEHRNFQVNYEIQRELTHGRYHIMEKWGENDVRFFIYEPK